MTIASSPSERRGASERRVARLRAAFWTVEDALRRSVPWRVRGRHVPPAIDPDAPRPPAQPPQADGDSLRVLRWVFSRGTDTLVCELALSSDATVYELRTVLSSSRHAPSTERFAEVTAAFQRQCALEGSLLADGWTLDSYDAVVADRRGVTPIAV